MLVSATYNGAKKAATLKFYDPEGGRIILWDDETGHRPYCYSKLSPDELSGIAGRDDIVSVERATRADLLEGRDVEVTKITAEDPLAIGGTNSDKSVRNSIKAWEADIKYYENYLYDNGLVVGRYYEVRGGRVVRSDMEAPAAARESLERALGEAGSSPGAADGAEFRRHAEEWADLLAQPIPSMRRLAVDIEVESEEGRIPDAKSAERRVTAVGFAASDGLKRVLVLRGAAGGAASAPGGVSLTEHESEAGMIRDAFDTLRPYPFLLTYNGDDFDLPYLYNRAKRLGIPDSENPLHMLRDAATLNDGVHLDLYRTFSNRSFQVYAFGAKYSSYSLNAVSEALLGRGKIGGAQVWEMDAAQLAAYCYNDAELTLELTTFGDGVLMNLLVVAARIGRMPVDDIARVGVSQWIRSLLYYEHRARGALIPRRDDLEGRSEGVMGDAVIKDKKYRGGHVIDPVAGAHFGVTVMDFASLYPSIIKVKNLSYETVRCPHEGCRANGIPGTNHWACTERNGLTALVIGSLRDLRVNYYKSLSKDPSLTEAQRQQYTAVSQALKVILNASYGVMGAEIFPLYFLPAAEATAATGRHIILETIKRCREAGMEVLYGDTDSLFIRRPTAEQVRGVVASAKAEHGVELEVDKEYRYVVLSDRKKNYLGVTPSGKVDVKGLTGKKSHTPRFIKDLFYEITGALAGVEDEGGFARAKRATGEHIAASVRRLEAGEIPMDDLAFRVTLSKDPSEYVKTVPQHIRAARQIEASGREVRRGDIVSYVKTTGRAGVRPAAEARRGEIDTKKYLEFMESTLDQITSVLDLDFDELLGRPKQTGMEQFFY